MTNLQPETNWVGDETDHLTGYAEMWRLDEIDAFDEDDDDEDSSAELT